MFKCNRIAVGPPPPPKRILHTPLVIKISVECLISLLGSAVDTQDSSHRAKMRRHRDRPGRRPCFKLHSPLASLFFSLVSSLSFISLPHKVSFEGLRQGSSSSARMRFSLMPRSHPLRGKKVLMNLGKKLGPRAGICAFQSDHSSSVVMTR